MSKAQASGERIEETDLSPALTELALDVTALAMMERRNFRLGRRSGGGSSSTSSENDEGDSLWREKFLDWELDSFFTRRGLDVREFMPTGSAPGVGFWDADLVENPSLLVTGRLRQRGSASFEDTGESSRRTPSAILGCFCGCGYEGRVAGVSTNVELLKALKCLSKAIEREVVVADARKELEGFAEQDDSHKPLLSRTPKSPSDSNLRILTLTENPKRNEIRELRASSLARRQLKEDSAFLYQAISYFPCGLAWTPLGPRFAAFAWTQGCKCFRFRVGRLEAVMESVASSTDAPVSQHERGGSFRRTLDSLLRVNNRRNSRNPRNSASAKVRALIRFASLFDALNLVLCATGIALPSARWHVSLFQVLAGIECACVFTAILSRKRTLRLLRSGLRGRFWRHLEELRSELEGSTLNSPQKEKKISALV